MAGARAAGRDLTGACLLVGATVLQLASSLFTLSWMHSVEHVEWQETWEVQKEGLKLVGSAVKGSGAGMEPDPDARLVDGWWVSRRELSVERLTLASSGVTEGGWTLCSTGTCRVFGAETGLPLVVAPCETESAQAPVHLEGALPD